MPLLVLSDADVRQLLSYPDCVAVVRSALVGLAEGRADQPLRSLARLAGAPGPLGLMPAYLAAGPGSESESGPGSDEGAYGLKAITINPANADRGLDTHFGTVMMFDGQTGEPRALLNGSAVTEIRTAAVSVLATDVLARPGAADLAVIGTGVQARAHILAFSQTRPLDRIRVAGRSQARAIDLAADLRPQVSADIIGCGSVARRWPGPTSSSPSPARPSPCWSAAGSPTGRTSTPWGPTIPPRASWTGPPWPRRPCSRTAGSRWRPSRATSCWPWPRGWSGLATCAPSWARC